MKAIVQDGYGAPHEVLALKEVDRPEVGEGEVLVAVRAASVNPADWHYVRGDPKIARLSFGMRGPKDVIPGCDLAGVVEAVGAGVVGIEPGDEVMACAFMNGFGAFAEAVSIASELVASSPAALEHGGAAALPLAAVTALQGLRDHAGVGEGDRVLILGASGGVGTFTVQIAKSLGAEVTGVCGSTNVDLVRSLGADDVIDYTSGEPLEKGAGYDVVFQLAGTASATELRRAVREKGTVLISSGESDGHLIGPVSRSIAAQLAKPFVSERLVGFTMTPNAQDLEAVGDLVDSGQVKPVIDRTYPLAEVPAALEYLEQGHARGKIVIEV